MPGGRASVGGCDVVCLGGIEARLGEVIGHLLARGAVSERPERYAASQRDTRAPATLMYSLLLESSGWCCPCITKCREAAGGAESARRKR